MLPPRPVAEVTESIKALPLVLLNFKQPVNVVVYRMLLFYYVLIGMFFQFIICYLSMFLKYEFVLLGGNSERR